MRSDLREVLEHMEEIDAEGGDFLEAISASDDWCWYSASGRIRDDLGLRYIVGQYLRTKRFLYDANNWGIWANYFRFELFHILRQRLTNSVVHFIVFQSLPPALMEDLEWVRLNLRTLCERTHPAGTAQGRRMSLVLLVNDTVDELDSCVGSMVENSNASLDVSIVEWGVQSTRTPADFGQRVRYMNIPFRCSGSFAVAYGLFHASNFDYVAVSEATVCAVEPTWMLQLIAEFEQNAKIGALCLGPISSRSGGSGISVSELTKFVADESWRLRLRGSTDPSLMKKILELSQDFDWSSCFQVYRAATLDRIGLPENCTPEIRNGLWNREFALRIHACGEIPKASSSTSETLRSFAAAERTLAFSRYAIIR